MCGKKIYPGTQDQKEHYQADNGVETATDLHLLPHILQESQAHETEAYGQDKVGNEIGDAQGCGVLGKLAEALYLAPTGDGNDQGEQKEAAIDHDPADFLPALRQFFVDNVDADGRSFLDGNTESQIGDPDEDVAGNFFGPDHCACCFKQVGDNVAVKGLQGDEADNGYEAGDKKDFFEVFVKPVPCAFFFFVYSCGHGILSEAGKGKGGCLLYAAPSDY